MVARNLRSGATGCWARLDGLRCERVQGHLGWHYCEGAHWVDHADAGFYGPEGVVDVNLDDYNPDGAA